MRDADDQFLNRLAEEIEPVVARFGTFLGLRLEEDPKRSEVRIIVAVVGSAGPIELVLTGRTLLEAASGWPARLGEARLALAFRELVVTHGLRG